MPVVMALLWGSALVAGVALAVLLWPEKWEGDG